MRGVAVVGLMLALLGGLASCTKPVTEPAPPASKMPVHDGFPALNEDGQHPQVTVDTSAHDFGSMEVGQQGSHTFLIRNTGSGPLVLKKGETTCKCTFSQIVGEAVQPGSATEVTLTWSPKDRFERFRQEASILTNDPKLRTLKLSIEGLVEARVVLKPYGTWSLGDIRDSGETVFTGTLHSPSLNEFKITKLTAQDPKTMRATFEPMPADSLKENHAKCGYLVKLFVSPSVPVGIYHNQLFVETDVRKPDTASGDFGDGAAASAPSQPGSASPATDSKSPAGSQEGASSTETKPTEETSDGKSKTAETQPAASPSSSATKPAKLAADAVEYKTFAVQIVGNRSGPLTIVGPGWDDTFRIARMGNFPAKTGKKIQLSMFIKRAPEEGVEFEQVESDLPDLKVNFERDTKFEGKSQRYFVTIEYPAGAPLASRKGEVPAKIRYKTNHPQIAEFHLEVHLEAY